MSKYHASAPKAPFIGVGGTPLCGSRNKDRYNVLTCSAASWNALPADQRCSKCVEKIRARKTVTPLTPRDAGNGHS